jgi:hypothetical protein
MSCIAVNLLHAFRSFEARWVREHAEGCRHQDKRNGVFRVNELPSIERQSFSLQLPLHKPQQNVRKSGGRPKVIKPLQELAQEHTEMAITTLVMDDVAPVRLWRAPKQ